MQVQAEVWKVDPAVQLVQFHPVNLQVRSTVPQQGELSFILQPQAEQFLQTASDVPPHAALV